MKVTRRQILPLSAGALMILRAGPGQARTGSQPFRCGAGIHTMMNWGSLRDDDPTRYVSEPFETPRNALPEGLARQMTKAGFDFVRMSLDVGPFLQLEGADRAALERKLLGNIERFHALGLDVVVDCHPVEQVPLYAPQSILEDLEGPLFGSYNDMIGRLAALLGGVSSGTVALELMNEPAIANAAHHMQVMVWNAAQLVLHDTARRAAPELPLVLTGADYGGISGLRDLDPSPYADSNVFYSFHYYLPIAFTHQGVDFGAPDAPASPYVSDLPYPYDAVPAKAVAEAVEARIAAAPVDADAKAAARKDATRIVDGFLAEAWNRDRLGGDFDLVSHWADRNGIGRDRIILGEFGVTKRSPKLTGAGEVYRRRWMADVTALARAAGFGWSVWDLNSYQMGINGVGDPDRLDAGLVSVLALPGQQP